MNDQAVSIAEYGQWISPLSAERVFQASEAVSYLRPATHGVFFLLSLPVEGNSMALMFRAWSGELTRVSPEGMNLRSRVHEYGGLSYAFTDTEVVYCNFRDQRLMKQTFDQLTLEAGPALLLGPPLEIKADMLRYADMLIDSRRRRLICIREDKRGMLRRDNPDSEPLNALVAIDLDSGGEGEVLYSGSDFVSSPVLNADASLIAFQTWSHPDMPWDSTRIHVGSLDDAGRISTTCQVAHSEEGSLVQPRFHRNGDLYFLADWSDWWNLYRIDGNDLLRNLQQGSKPEAQAVFPVDGECCGAQWQLGARNYDFSDDGSILISINRNCFWELALVDTHSGRSQSLLVQQGSLEHLSCRDGEGLYIAASASDSMAIFRQQLQPGAAPEVLYRCARSDGLDCDWISKPRHLAYPTADNATAFGIFYPPCNPHYSAPVGSLPPLLVLVHGGPTGSARTAFNPAVQFWTSRGFAVLDVNHRGSTGYGRRFRQSLYRHWGVADVADVDHSVQWLISEGLADQHRIAIRGGSAGGYVVLAALVSSSRFSAGASYYGIGDLEMLARDTHKFESRYLDQLIGPYPAMQQVYRDRSPLHQVERITAAVLLLQGMEDKVVPPNQAEAMFEKLRQRNPATRLVCFADEGHGFRNPQNQIAALDQELAFYQSNLGVGKILA